MTPENHAEVLSPQEATTPRTPAGALSNGQLSRFGRRSIDVNRAAALQRPPTLQRTCCPPMQSAQLESEGSQSHTTCDLGFGQSQSYGRRPSLRVTIDERTWDEQQAVPADGLTEQRPAPNSQPATLGAASCSPDGSSPSDLQQQLRTWSGIGPPDFAEALALLAAAMPTLRKASQDTIQAPTTVRNTYH